MALSDNGPRGIRFLRCGQPGLIHPAYLPIRLKESAMPVLLTTRQTPCSTPLRVSVIAALCLAGAAAQAQNTGTVRAEAAGVVQESATQPSATASSGSFSATATRTSTLASGAISNNFTALRTAADASTRSYFTIVGLDGTVPLTFHWEFTGTRGWSTESASFGGQLVADLRTGAFISVVGWGISYVDGPAFMGDFAGSLQGSFGVSAAGSLFSNTLPGGAWDGQGSRSANTTMEQASSGATGSFYLESSFGISGDVQATYTSRLVGVTAANAGPGAYLQLDNGSRISITSAVPEPQTWGMLVSGLLAMAGMAARRRRN